MKQILSFAACLSSLFLSASAFAQTPYPMLLSLRPVASQIGATTEHDVVARYNLYGAYRVIVSGEGVIGEVVQPEKKPDEKPPETKPIVNRAKLRFTVAADAVPGVRDFRVITPQGASTVGQLVVGRDPIVVETSDNNTVAKAQAVTLPSTLCGAIESGEDIDCFKFKAEAGTGVVFHVRSRRLEDRIHDLQTQVDPIITLRNAAGGTVAMCDNYYSADPLLYHHFEQAGDYVLEIRDVRFKGNAEWVYSIEASSRPFVTQVQPLAVTPGTENKLALVGYNLPADAAATLALPTNSPLGLRWVSPVVNGHPANEMAVMVTSLPTAIESTTDNNTPATAQAVSTAPTMICGRIDAPGDIDCFTFDAKKGERYTFEVIARRAQSELDSNLRILNDKGAVQVEGDDSRVNRVAVSDSWIEFWAPPADGKYTIEIRDLHLRGGAQYTYAIQVTHSKPEFLLETDTDKTLLSPGTNAPLYVKIERKNGFTGEVQLAVEGMPPGVTALAGKILADGTDGVIILQSAANAPAGAANIRITGKGTHKPAEGSSVDLTAVSSTLQEVYSPGGGRAHFPVDLHTVSVADPMDIRGVKLSTSAVTLKPGESQKIDIEIARAPGMKQNVTLDVLFQHLERPYGNSLPKGVTIDGGKSKTLLTGEETKGFITLKAAADAPPVQVQLVPVMAHVSVNFVMKMTYCEPLTITVTPK